MALSDYEKQVLEEMEAQFDHQPSSFRDHVREDAHSPRSSSKLSPKRVAVGSLMIVAGLLILVAAVSLGYFSCLVVLGMPCRLRGFCALERRGLLLCSVKRNVGIAVPQMNN